MKVKLYFSRLAFFKWEEIVVEGGLEKNSIRGNASFTFKVGPKPKATLLIKRPKV